MTGVKKLTKLLHSLNPQLDESEFVFCSFPYADIEEFWHLSPVAFVSEYEGFTFVIYRQTADSHGFKYEKVFKRITLAVHSSLEAVGFTAAVSGALAENGIVANIIAGFYHDHIFVSVERAEEALNILNKIKP